MSDPLIAPPFLFRFSVPCRSTRGSWDPQRGIELGEEYSTPSFAAELGSGPRFADLRIAWSGDGIYFQVQTRGKKQAPWCRESRLDESDGLRLWIDSRDTQSIHRAGRFCHQFVFLPSGGGGRLDEPVAELLNIDRARENPQQPPRGTLKVRSEKRVDGYSMCGWIPSSAMTGFDADEYRRLGFCYAVMDRELGWYTFSLGAEYPFTSDPSLWGSMDLVP